MSIEYIVTIHLRDLKEPTTAIRDTLAYQCGYLGTVVGSIDILEDEGKPGPPPIKARGTEVPPLVTVITYHQSDPEAVVKTHDPKLIRQLHNQAATTDRVRTVREWFGFGEYRVDKKMVKIGKRMTMTEEDMADRVERLKRARTMQKKLREEKVNVLDPEDGGASAE